MTKETIVERLVDQGHITINWADIILNRKDGYIERITELHTDGNVNTIEAVCLLISNPTTSTPSFPFGTPNTFPSYPPLIPPYQPGQPNIYCGPADRYGIPLHDDGTDTKITDTGKTTTKYPKTTTIYNQDIP